MVIHLLNDTPIHHRPRKLSYEEREALKTIIEDLLRNDIIRPSESPYASAIVMAKKKSGVYRKSVDFRTLNKITDSRQLSISSDRRVLRVLRTQEVFHHFRS